MAYASACAAVGMRSSISIFWTINHAHPVSRTGGVDGDFLRRGLRACLRRVKSLSSPVLWSACVDTYLPTIPERYCGLPRRRMNDLPRYLSISILFLPSRSESTRYLVMYYVCCLCHQYPIWIFSDFYLILTQLHPHQSVLPI